MTEVKKVVTKATTSKLPTLDLYTLPSYADKLILQEDGTKFVLTERYKVSDRLGCGAYGCVYKITNRSTKKDYALKFSLLQAVDALEREWNLLSAVKHSNIISVYWYYKVWYNNEHVGNAILMEYLDMSLFDYIDKNGAIVESVATSLLIQILNALYYLHSIKYVHGDLKPGNIVIDKEGNLKLIDFGVARKESDLRHGKSTIWYRAPEDSLKERLSSKIDMWATACIFVQMLTGVAPFRKYTDLTNIGEIYSKLQIADVMPTNKENSNEIMNLSNAKAIASLYSGAITGGSLNKLLYNLLAVMPNNRYSAAEALNSTYIKEYIIAYKQQ